MSSRFVQPLDGVEITKKAALRGAGRRDGMVGGPMNGIRTFLGTAAALKAREATFDGQNYLVVPVIAMVEGVIRANGSKGPEYVPQDVLSMVPEGWNGRPVFYAHPEIDGSHVSGNTPAILEQAVGLVFNSAIQDGKLKMEAWIHTEQTTAGGQELLKRLKDGEDMEISIGAFVEVKEGKGNFRGANYDRVWRRMTPDHLALLPANETGACSRKMGCGVRTARGGRVMSDQPGGIVGRLLSLFRGAQHAADMNDNDLRKKLHKKTGEKDSRVQYVEAVYKDKKVYVYAAYKQDGQYAIYQRGFELAETGDVTVDDSVVEVEPVLYYEPVGSAGEPRTASAGTGACRCHNSQPKQEATMACKTKVAALIGKLSGRGFAQADAAFLESLTDEQFAKIEALGEPVTVEKVVEKEVKVEVLKEVKVEVPAAPKTLSEAIAPLPESEKTAFVAFQAAEAAKKAATIKTLKDSGRCTFSDEQLGGKSQAELDQLVSLTGAKVDFSGAGAPRGGDQKPQGVPAAPSMTGAITAARAAKQ